MVPFLQVKVSIVNSAGGTFCWNYATDTFYGNYASDNVCCIFAGSEVVLSVTSLLVDLSVTTMQFLLQLEVSSAHIQVTVSAANMRVTIFIVIRQMGVSGANYAGGIFCSALCKWLFPLLLYRWLWCRWQFLVTISYSFSLNDSLSL